LSALGRIQTVLRTVRWLRPAQVSAQLMHLVRGSGSPVRLAEAAPELAVRAPLTPFLPAPAHARFDGERTLRLINRELIFGSEIDWDYAGHGPLFAYHLHQCDYLRDPDLSAQARAAVVLDWIERHPHGTGWDPHPISLRTLCWGKLLLSPDCLALSSSQRAVVRHAMAEQVETLDRNIEVRLQANHLLSNLIGVVFAAVLFEGPRADRWLRRADWLSAELDQQILSDGGHVERSPMYHALLLESLLDLGNLASARPGRLPTSLDAGIRSHASRMLGALEVWLHPDDEIALFSDAAFGIAQPASALRGYASELGLSALQPAAEGVLDRTGYVRLDASPFTLIASVEGPLPAYQPGHAHCDALSFELSCGTERVVTDTGVYEYVAGENRDAARGTAGHATLQFGEREQAEIWSAHRVGGRPRVRLESFEAGARAVASCVPWSEPQRLHRRTFSVQPGAIEINDVVEGGACPVVLRLPLAPGLAPRLVHDADGATEAQVVLQSGSRLRIALPAAADWRIDSAPYFPEFGRREERALLIGEAHAFESGTYRFELVD
jgi:uncharacterized heparinase superfamily protein